MVTKTSRSIAAYNLKVRKEASLPCLEGFDEMEFHASLYTGVNGRSSFTADK